MRPEDLVEIRQLPLFRNMLQANFSALMQAAYAQRFPAGLELIRQGAAPISCMSWSMAASNFTPTGRGARQ